jgi:hypothetical protein
MGKKLAVLQSNYIPWKGYFDLINSVDEFILYDDMQYTKNDWRNRNKIKTPQGVQWLTIPVKQESLTQTIRDTCTVSNQWRQKHWKTISQAYVKSKFFAQYKMLFEDLYLQSDEASLCEINLSFIKAINTILDIKTRVSRSDEYRLIGDRNERLVNLCKQIGASVYLTGPAALAYMDCRLFECENISVHVADYSGYAEYSQLHPPFEHGVSIIDLIFNMGDRASEFMKSFIGSESVGKFMNPVVSSKQQIWIK